MSFALVTTRYFERRARKFLRKHPDLRQALRDTLDDLSRDPFQPKLELHSLTGSLAGVQAVRLTYSYRLTLQVRSTEQEVVLLDIGSHDEVYR
jgi:mRNA-degrading endonuclease YafQ of YafQ-DinJ toxin-antitoxin module